MAKTECMGCDKCYLEQYRHCPFCGTANLSSPKVVETAQDLFNWASESPMETPDEIAGDENNLKPGERMTACPRR